MIVYEDDHTGDYKGRNIASALEEARQMVDTILTPPDQTPLEVRQNISTMVFWTIANRSPKPPASP
jgi:hypothetical protein